MMRQSVGSRGDRPAKHGAERGCKALFLREGDPDLPDDTRGTCDGLCSGHYTRLAISVVLPSGRVTSYTGLDLSVRCVHVTSRPLVDPGSSGTAIPKDTEQRPRRPR